mmetsp:Transcript_31449/g.35215  ORF Transcript_31449/g.35215 Transcript_31449/m.35215 type:complete len:448 (-) Transcript_31449:293-1636(-)
MTTIILMRVRSMKVFYFLLLLALLMSDGASFSTKTKTNLISASASASASSSLVHHRTHRYSNHGYLQMTDDWSSGGNNDSNKWVSSINDYNDDDNNNNNNNNNSDDNENENEKDSSNKDTKVNDKDDEYNIWHNTMWSDFESFEEEEGTGTSLELSNKNSNSDDENDDNDVELIDDSELWLNTLAAISAEEIDFNQKENERADKVRKMQEWGFDDTTIRNTFDVAIDDSKETKDEAPGMSNYRQGLYKDDIDWEDDDELMDTVESHSRVDIDKTTGEPIRQQHVYVDEHACIGCTNCATIAQSTFFMESGMGRARVFAQWGDKDDTIATAIETCPVDCIYYVPYEELVALEVDRRDQRINNQARLVNQGESAHMASTSSHNFSAPQLISGNAGSRCQNCPTNGCHNCPMFGVGKNPEYERREQVRLISVQRKKLEQERANNNKSVQL